MITIRFLHPLLSINSLLIVVFKLQLIPDTVRQWEPISPLTLDNNERDFTVLAQSIGASYVCVRESGSVAAWVRWWSKEARETMVPYHVLGICVWCKGWVIYYYYHYYPLTTTSMAPIEKTKQKRKEMWNPSSCFVFCFCFSGIGEIGNTCRIHAEFYNRWRKQHKNQNHLSLIRYSLTSTEILELWNITLRYDLKSLVSYISIPHQIPNEYIVYVYITQQQGRPPLQSRESWKNDQISHADLPTQIIHL